MSGDPKTGPVAGAVEVRIADLVLVRRPGEPLADLATALARQLAAHGAPGDEATATAILDHADGLVGP